MEKQHVKSFNVDEKGKNRFRFASSKQRSKKVSADVYRSYKRRFGVTSAAEREESVHRPKRRKEGDAEEEEDDEVAFNSTFEEELELANERNASALFGEFYRELWPLVRSVPELLHHSALVVDLILAYMMSPESSPMEKTRTQESKEGQQCMYLVNHATTDMLHLLAVLAKDMQQEIHVYVYDKILPRIVMDLLNPPAPPVESGKQAIPVDVLIVETAFRTLSYIFQHDAEMLVTESAKKGEEPCLEQIRKYYGPTLGHKREVVRRLAAETFAPLVRRIKTDGARKRHLKRTLRALTKIDSGSPSQTLKRAKADAIDGVSNLLFETAKGVSGRLHSKGTLIIRCVLDHIVGLDQDFTDSMSVLTSQFLQKVYAHIRNGIDRKFEEVGEELRRFMTRMLEKTPKNSKQLNDSAFVCSISIVQEVVEFRHGTFFAAGDEKDADTESERRLKRFIQVVGDLTEPERCGSMPLSSSTAVLKLFFVLWNRASKLTEEESFFEKRLSKMLQSSETRKHDENSTLLTSVIVQTYLEACTEADAVRVAFPSILSSIANLVSVDADQAMNMMFRVVSRVPLETEGQQDDDNIFPMASEKGGFSCDRQACQKLLERCMVDKINAKSTCDIEKLAQLSYSVRCIPFLCSITDGINGYESEKRTLTWMLENIKILVEPGTDETSIYDRLVPAALLVEGFARVVSYIYERCKASWLKELVLRCRPMAWGLVLSCPGSLWAMKSAAALCEVLRVYEMPICDDSNIAFDNLVSNLRMESHFLRLYSLRILSTFPPRPYVVNHGDLDLSDDLDEEPGFVAPAELNQSGLSGRCDIINTLLKIESLPAGVDTERAIAGLLTRAEVIGKSGKLPIAYAEALANHMLGVFHVRFSSVWVGASRALRGLSLAHHTILCDTTGDALERLLLPDAADTQHEEVAVPDLDHVTHQRLCAAWDSSHGRNASLFQMQIDSASEEGRVSPFLSTDRETVFQEVMKILEFVPEITAKHSRRIVPMFLNFLKTQYYCFHDKDPDARELQIDRFVEGESDWKKEMMNRKTLQNRLRSFLRAFAAVKGSQQLYQRSLLLSIFNVNLSHQDAAVADASLTCLVNFRLPFIAQYAEKLQNLLKKGGLRDALLDFNLSKESETIHPEHRQHLLPVVERILFGRISTSSMRGTKSKDSPIARRKAIVSCLAQLEGDELFPLIYLMIRNYIPSSCELKWEEIATSEFKEKVLGVMSTAGTLPFGDIPIQRHEGFLNLLSVLIAQLGHGLDQYIPSFMPILLGVLKCTTLPRRDDADMQIDTDTSESEPRDFGASQRLRAVRTLSIRCIAAVMDKFADSIDFTPYSETLWEGISTTVTDLPSIVAKSSSTPSILSLLVVLSSHSSYRSILETNRTVVESVIKCIGPTSEDKALDAALDFILNLMDSPKSAAASDAPCDELIGSQVLLLLRQFRSRFGGVIDEASTNDDAPETAPRAMKTSKTLSKELLVLRRVGDVLLDGRFMPKTSKREDVQAELYNTLSSLLVQFLSLPRTQEADQKNVLRIVSALLPKVDAATALSHFSVLSKLLSYEHWSRLSPSTRREVTATMGVISRCNGMSAALDRISRLLQEIFAVHTKRVDEMDYDRVLPALSGLYDSDVDHGWASLLSQSTAEDCMSDTERSEPKLLTPVIYACFALLQQDDVVVSRSAFKALRNLITASSSVDHIEEVGVSETPWSKLIEATVVPGARSALRSSNEQIRRHAVSLLAEVSKNFANSSSPNLHGDLNILACEENPDLDFFLNILHVQAHRRNRALQRLRTRLNELEVSGKGLSVNSLSNVLLPLVTFPIYECKTNLEEGLAQESIATIGALGRHLSWSKYHAVLWTALNQFSRHPDQERLIIGMICSLLDSFHFDLIDTDGGENRETAVWRALEKRVIPKIESLLVKEKRDRRGRDTKSIRPNVVLALLKLLKKFPSAYFEKRLPRLLAVVCDALKNRESNVRDLARKALAAMVVEMGPAYLSEVIRSLAVTLKEGYQLHVRSATLHHILFHLSNIYGPPQGDSVSFPDFDRCIPAMMDLIMQDMFGVASERRDDDGAPKRLVKEAAGSKYLDSVEIICHLLRFKPFEMLGSEGSTDRSSVHCVVTPFFEKLREESISTKNIQKIKECLRRVVIGLSRNKSACVNEMLQFIYATIAPILEWSTAQVPSEQRSLSSGDPSPKRAVVVWQPASIAAAQNAKDAMLGKLSDQAELATVKDGTQAPKLTGTGRHTQKQHSDQLNSPTSVCAVEFGLNMLLTTVKTKAHEDSTDVESRLTPFLTLLTNCVCESRENVVTTLSIRCIALLLKKGVNPSPEVLNPLGSKIIDILSTGEAIIGANQELTQTCMVALTTLLKLQVTGNQQSREGNVQGEVLSLSEEQMSVLVSLLKESVVSCDDSNAALGTVKALLAHRFVSPELYDLMERLLELSVRSHRESFRDQCCNVFVQFLVDYPLSKKRFEQHLRQVMLNVKYEHKEGRMSTIRLVSTLIERLPLDLIDEKVQLIFLPLVLQLVNDDSEDCRESVSKSLARLVCRVSGNVALSLFDYVLRWHKGDNDSLRRASLQLFGIFAEGRNDILAQNDGAQRILECLQSSLESTDTDWEQHYFALVSLEKVIQQSTTKFEEKDELWSAVLLELSHPHLWVKMISSRIIGEQLQQHDPKEIGKSDKKTSVLISRKGSLYDLATNFCGQLDEEESNMSMELSDFAIKSLTWLAQAMDSNPDLCYADGEGEGKEPVKWLLTRLSNVARRKGTLRRKAVFKCYAALCHAGGADMIGPYLDLIIEPLHRAIIEAAGAMNHFGTEKYSAESRLAKEVMAMLEDGCEDDFLAALAKVKVRARERRDQRKNKLAAERIADPAAAARKKIEKQVNEKDRRKRNVQGHRGDRGGTAKRRHI